MPAAPLSSLERLGDTFALDSSAQKKRMLVIVNPYATTVSDRLKTLVVYALQGRYDVQAVDTEKRDHATELCREAAHEGYDVVVSFGGDGTVNEAANGLLGSATPLTCLPGGSSNVFCRMLGIPVDIVDATEHLLRVADTWQPRPVDMGIVNGRRFTFSSGVGLDAAVVRRVDANPRLKARLRDWYFTYVAIGTFTRRYLVNPPRMRTELPGRPEHRRGHHRGAERAPVHVLQGPAHRHRRGRASSTRATSPARCSSAPGRSTCRRSCGARSPSGPRSGATAA